MQIKVGFIYKGFRYGWFENQLYRLPKKRKRRYLTLKKLPIIKVGNQEGYRLAQDRKSKLQIQLMNKLVDWNLEIIECDHCG